MKPSLNWRMRLPLLVGACMILGGVGLARTMSSEADDPSLGNLPLKQVADVPLPGHTTRLDYESYDQRRHLLFIAHLGDGEVIAFDTGSSRVVAGIGDVSSVHGVLVIPELSRVYASATGTNEIVAIDEATLKIVARMPGGRRKLARTCSKRQAAQNWRRVVSLLKIDQSCNAAHISLSRCAVQIRASLIPLAWS